VPVMSSIVNNVLLTMALILVYTKLTINLHTD